MIYPVHPDNAVEEQVELLLIRPDRRSIDASKDVPLVWLCVTAITSFLIWLRWTFATVRQALRNQEKMGSRFRSLIDGRGKTISVDTAPLIYLRFLASFCQNGRNLVILRLAI